MTAVGSPVGGTVSFDATNVHFTPAADFNGAASFQYTITDNGTTNGSADPKSSTATVNFNVIAVDDTPSVTNATTEEDKQTTSGLVISRNAVDGAEVTHFKITGIANGTLFKNDGNTHINNTDFITVADGNAGLKFTPAANLFSPSTAFSFTVQGATSAVGAGLSSGTAIAVITVNSANDAPSFTKGPDQSVSENSGAQTVNNWATNLSAGPANESGQTLTFQVTNNTNSALFSAGPAISSTGTLTYTPAANTSGTAAITVVLKDNGGTANGGVDTSAPQTFSITVNDGGRLSLSSATYSVTESAGNAVVTITRTGGTAGTATVQFATRNGTAAAGSGQNPAPPTVSLQHREHKQKGEGSALQRTLLA